MLPKINNRLCYHLNLTPQNGYQMLAQSYDTKVARAVGSLVGELSQEQCSPGNSCSCQNIILVRVS